MADEMTLPHSAARGIADPERLCDGELELDGRLSDASNATFLARLVRPGDVSAELRVVYKPRLGERPLDDFPGGTLANRERAAYLLSEATGWSIVPPTVLRDGPFGPGMVQQWIDADPARDVVDMVLAGDARLRRVCLFDALANNADRKAGHLLPVGVSHVYGVDHGVCFAVAPKLRTVLWGWRGQELRAGERATVQAVARALGGRLGEQLCELLSPAEVRATLGRAECLLEEGRFPEPDPRRPAVPWPPF